MRGREIAAILAGVALAILVLLLLGGGMMFAAGAMGPWMMGWGGYGFNPLAWIVMLAFWALVFGGVALLAVWLFRGGGPAAAGPAHPARPLEILQERYARGEITREQYEQMRRDLDRG
jgi:putative membrane protein